MSLKVTFRTPFLGGTSMELEALDMRGEDSVLLDAIAADANRKAG